MADEMATATAGQAGESGAGSRAASARPQRPAAAREGGARKYFRRKKVCKFCVEKIDSINYKDVRLLSQFVAESGKIVPRRLTGVCTPHQRRLTVAIKQARNIALLPFSARV
jgi:small subunit ribosomal protein S18